MSDDQIFYERFDDGPYNAYRVVGTTSPVAGDPDELAKKLGVSPSLLTFRESDADRQARELRKLRSEGRHTAIGTMGDIDLFTGRLRRW